MKIFFVFPLLTLAVSSAFAQLEPHDTHLAQKLEPNTTTKTSTVCDYEISVKTGDVEDAGTDSRISLMVSSNDGHGLEIQNLKSWGRRIDIDRDCFRRGNLDRFEGKGECLPSEPCKMLLRSDGTGAGPGWYVDYVKITQFDPDVSVIEHKFTVGEWLAIQEGYNLYASRDDCGHDAAMA